MTKIRVIRTADIQFRQHYWNVSPCKNIESHNLSSQQQYLQVWESKYTTNCVLLKKRGMLTTLFVCAHWHWKCICECALFRSANWNILRNGTKASVWQRGEWVYGLSDRLLCELMGTANGLLSFKGLARTLNPTIKNCAPEPRRFDVVTEVNPFDVQWTGLALAALHWWA